MNFNAGSLNVFQKSLRSFFQSPVLLITTAGSCWHITIIILEIEGRVTLILEKVIFLKSKDFENLQDYKLRIFIENHWSITGGQSVFFSLQILLIYVQENVNL